MNEARRGYLPAAGHDWLLPFYDPFVNLLGGERARQSLIDQAALRPGQRVLDIGCGTGELVVALKRRHPDVDVVGIDPDPKALARAKRKIERRGLSVQLDRGFADDLPYADASFDRVLSSFMFHHLESEQKETMLRETRRVLRPGGILYLVDFGGSTSAPKNFVARLFHSGHRLSDNYEGRILARMHTAGFRDAREVGHGAMFFMPIAYYEAPLPASSRA